MINAQNKTVSLSVQTVFEKKDKQKVKMKKELDTQKVQNTDNR